MYSYDMVFTAHLRPHDTITIEVSLAQVGEDIERIILFSQLPPPLVHSLTEHSILYRQLPLAQLGASGVAIEVTGNAMALAAPG